MYSDQRYMCTAGIYMYSTEPGSLPPNAAGPLSSILSSVLGSRVWLQYLHAGATVFTFDW